MRVTVDDHTCIGSGNCVVVCPDVFQQRDDGIAEVQQPDVLAGLAESAREAERTCPSGAIAIEE